MAKKYVTNLRYISSGVVDICKSPGVTALLQSQADKCAARCNSLAHLTNARQAPRYEAETKMLRYTAAGRVHIANGEAYVDNLYHNTLKKGCNI